MPITTRHIRIQAPIERVWAELADVPGQPRWMHDLRSITFLDDRPVGVGSVMIGEVRMFGLTQADPIEITAFGPTHRYAIAHRAFTGRGEFRLWSTEGGQATQVDGSSSCARQRP
jgi:uncharacterized protein YndB with AHSA1/START domain